MPWQSRPVLQTQMQESVKYFREKDATIRKFFDDCNGLMVFPDVYKAPGIEGGAFGRGEVYEKGNIAGNATVFLETATFSVPGEHFREIVFFQYTCDLEKFKKQELILGNQIKGTALSEGVGAKTEYINGMAIFVMADAGPMTDISVAGQRLKYAPIEQ